MNDVNVTKGGFEISDTNGKTDGVSIECAYEDGRCSNKHASNVPLFSRTAALGERLSIGPGKKEGDR